MLLEIIELRNTVFYYCYFRYVLLSFRVVFRKTVYTGGFYWISDRTDRIYPPPRSHRNDYESETEYWFP